MKCWSLKITQLGDVNQTEINNAVKNKGPNTRWNTRNVFKDFSLQA